MNLPAIDFFSKTTPPAPSTNPPIDRPVNPPPPARPPANAETIIVVITMSTDDNENYRWQTVCDALGCISVRDGNIYNYFERLGMLNETNWTNKRYSSPLMKANIDQQIRRAMIALHPDKNGGTNLPIKLRNAREAGRWLKNLYEYKAPIDLTSIEEGEEGGWGGDNYEEALKEDVEEAYDEDEDEEVEDDREAEEEAEEEEHNDDAYKEEDERNSSAAALLLPSQDDPVSTETAQETAKEKYKDYIGFEFRKEGFWFEGTVMAAEIVELKRSRKQQLCFRVEYEDGDVENVTKELLKKDFIIDNNADDQIDPEIPFVGRTVWKTFSLIGEVIEYVGEAEGPTFLVTFRNTINAGKRKGKEEHYDWYIPISQIPLKDPSTPARKKTSKKKETKKKSPRKRQRCNTCVACLRDDDCRKCIECMDKPANGGRGKRKQICVERKCQLMK